MANVGQVMENPVSGERFVWLQTAEGTNGEFCEFELHLDQGAVVAAAHVHPEQQETFNVKSGSIRLNAGGQGEVLCPGDERTIPAGTAHSWGNVANGPTVVLVRFTPALRSEDFFETFCGLGRDGRANSKGIPRNPLQLAVWAHEFRREVRPTGIAGHPPVTTAIRGLAALGRAAGYRARYPQYA